MADVICVIGSKGGTGKTTLAHMMGHGLVLLGHEPVCVFSDEHGEPLDPVARRYRYTSAGDKAQLEADIHRLRNSDSGLGIVDGGAARDGFDRALYDLADLVLLPFRDSCEDIRSVLRDMERFPHAYAIPCQWPTNIWQQRGANHLLDESLGHCRDRILEPVYTISASKILLQHRLPDTLPAMLGNACRDLAQQIAELLSLDSGCVSARNLYPASGHKRKIAA